MPDKTQMVIDLLRIVEEQDAEIKQLRDILFEALDQDCGEWGDGQWLSPSCSWYQRVRKLRAASTT
jgi:hypothetical protein